MSRKFITDDNIESFDNAFIDVLKYVATDDSMAPVLNIGDIAYIIEKNTYENGDTILFELENKRYIRKIIESDSKEQLELIAMNPYYTPMKTTKDKIKIIGKVIRAENQSAF